jgi:hypothetical protein
MMNEQQLYQMYQAWQQDQENYVRDWCDFVEWAAKWNRTTGDQVMKILQTTYWFERPEDRLPF